MTNIKKLFLTLSLLITQAMFCMDVPQPIQSPDGKKGWVQITKNEDFARFVEKCIVVSANPNLVMAGSDYYLYISPKQPSLDRTLDPNLYPVCLFRKVLIRGLLPGWYTCWRVRLENSTFQDDKHPFLVRLLTIEEARDLATAVKRNEFHVERYQNDDGTILDNTSLRLDCLTSEERKKYLTQQKINFESTTLLGIHRFRNSTLSVLPKDVVRFVCQLRTADIRRENPVLKFE